MQVVPVAALADIILLHFTLNGCGGSAKRKKSHEECLGKHSEGGIGIEVGGDSEAEI